MIQLQIDRIDSPLGEIMLVVHQGALCALDYADYEARMMRLLNQRFAHIDLVATPNPYGFSQRVQAYFAGDCHSLDSIPVSTGGTAFQQRVWTALRSIPVGAVLTYGALAQKIENPTAYRAVGMTNALNPIAIVLPCHRVIGANATLTGYAGGLERKQWLLRHEGVDLNELRGIKPEYARAREGAQS